MFCRNVFRDVKIKFYLFVAVCIAVTIVSCKKNKIDPLEEIEAPPCDTVITELIENDTIFSSDYIMAYPGSWWEYSNTTIIQSTDWQSVPICVVSKPECYELTRTYKILPNFNGARIHNESYISNDSALITTGFNKMVGGSGGEIYSQYMEGSYKHTTKCVGYLDSLVVGTVTYYDVIQTLYTYDVCKGSVSMGTVQGKISYYAKNVGLIRIRYYDHNMNFSTVNLVDYHIEPY